MLFTALLCQVLLATRLALAIPSSSDRLAARIARRNTASTHQSRPTQPIDAPSIHEANEINGLTNVTHAAKVSYTSNGRVLYCLPRRSSPPTRLSRAPSSSRLPNCRLVRTRTPGTLRRDGLESTVGLAATPSSRPGSTSAFRVLGGRVVSYNDGWIPPSVVRMVPRPRAQLREHQLRGRRPRHRERDRHLEDVTGTAKIMNKSTKKTVSHTFSGQPALCQEKAEWIVEDMTGGDGRLVPFVNFGSVEFIEATAHTVDGKTATPPSAGLVDLVANGRVITKVSTGPHSVTVSYVG